MLVQFTKTSGETLYVSAMHIVSFEVWEEDSVRLNLVDDNCEYVEGEIDDVAQAVMRALDTSADTMGMLSAVLGQLSINKERPA